MGSPAMTHAELDEYLDDYAALVLQAAWCRESTGTTAEARALVRGMLAAVYCDGKGDGLRKPRRPSAVDWAKLREAARG